MLITFVTSPVWWHVLSGRPVVVFVDWCRRIKDSCGVRACKLSPSCCCYDSNDLTFHVKLHMFRHLGTGCSMSDLSIDYRISLSTVSGILREGQCFPPLSVQLLLETAASFEKRANFPHCVAAVDGKHKRIIKPNDSGSLNWNFKHFFSILLLAACDSNYRFLYIDVASVSTTFKSTRLYTKLQSNKIKLPAPIHLSQQRPDQVPYVMIGDEGFDLSQFVLRPYGGRFLTVEKKVLTIV
ncbi:hypothetical protein PR048_006067 [Dryococelus australis]|uniref:DDE Tnp4 domain-containing protein n=1 Tax=Dryococelus australis TaxID=614101 RepID=A0ABQ9IB06_9NEOP|nr:hypothetical protein PR048_006067 [Dryococelus australis]